MKRIVWLTVWCVGVGGLAWLVLDHPGREKVTHLRSELEALRSDNEQIAKENRELRRRIRALRNDARALRRRARIAGGLARPDELIVQFENPETGGGLQVELVVSPEELSLVGETFSVEALSSELERARRDFPTARLAVDFQGDVGSERRREVLDAVRASAFRYQPDENREESSDEGGKPASSDGARR